MTATKIWDAKVAILQKGKPFLQRDVRKHEVI